ncbi:concanavalin A-like lectin/glucanase domain-containing protein [Boletus edulis]|nr:concanavalin A-like lectin/glucanase domain-containing protein [Boletus edulis]
MRLNFTLISTFLFASAVLADRGLEHRSSQLNIQKRNTSDYNGINWAGAVSNQSVPTFWAISSTFKAPHVSGPTESAVGIWVGIDGFYETKCGATFLAGVGYIMTNDKPFYQVVAQWLPGTWKEFTDVEVSPGDLITVTVTVASDQTTGNATIENANQMTTQTLGFSNQPALCQLSAEWIVSKVGDRDLANFSTVSFSNPLALGGYQKFTPAGSVVTSIGNETAIYADENVVTIWRAY